jgi:hypothetical protein
MCTSKLLVDRKKRKKTATTRRFQTKKALGAAAEGQSFIGKSRLEMHQNQSRGKKNKKKIVSPETEAKVGESQRAKEARACTTA